MQFMPITGQARRWGKFALILNSYHQLLWTREAEGAMAVLLESDDYISVHVEYMIGKLFHRII